MPEAAIISTARTPIGRAMKGTLVDTDAFTMAQHVVTAAVDRSGLDPQRIDDIHMAETLAGGGVIGRYIAIEAGLEHIPGASANRHCAAGLTAVTNAAASIKAGMDQVVIAGGTHSMSTAPRSMRRNAEGELYDWISPSHRDVPDAPNMDMSITVGWNAAQEAGVTREEMDFWACRSHERAVFGIDNGCFEDEIVPIEVKGPEGATLFSVDEFPRRDTTMETLAALKPLHPEIEGFSITAGNSSGLNDAAGAMVLAELAVAEAEGIAPMAIVRGWASAGVNPARTGLAPTVAIPKALGRVGLGIDDVDLWELNEAFASMCVGTCKVLGIDDEKVNVLGSGCSLGHPIAMTGARMIITLIHELQRRGGGTGVAAMCAGGGMSTAVVLDVPA